MQSNRTPHLSVFELRQLLDDHCERAVIELFRACNSAREQGPVAFDSWIASTERVLSSCPWSHPGRPYLLFGLANGKFYRYDTPSRQESDLDDIVIHLTQVSLLPFRIDGAPLDLVGVLCVLALTLVRRFESTRQASDLEYGIKYLRSLLYLPLNRIGIQFSRVSAELAKALSYKTRLHPDSEQENIDEVLTLYLSCLPWDPSEEDTASVLVRLAMAVMHRLSQTGKAERFEEVVGYLREARNLCHPKDLPELIFLLALVLTWQACQTGMVIDLQEIMTFFNENIPLLPPAHHLRPLTEFLMAIAISQPTGGNKSDGLVDAINICRATLTRFPPGPQYRATLLHILATLLRRRYELFGHEGCLKEAQLCTEEVNSLFRSKEVQSVREADNGEISIILSLIHADCSVAGLEEEIRRSDGRLAVTQPGGRGYYLAILNSHLLHQVKYMHSNSLANLEQATKYRQALLSSAPSIYRDVDMAQDFLWAFMQGGQEESLNKSIDICRSALEAQPQKLSRFRLFRILGTSLGLRSIQLGRLENLDECFAMFEAAFEEEYSDPFDRLQMASFWATVARPFKHPSAPAAYQNAMSALQDSLAIGPTVQAQHNIIGNLQGHMRIPLEYASDQIERGQLELAIETLEQGRSLLWSEMRGFRRPVDRLRRVDPILADTFLAISKSLELITTSIPPPPSSPHENMTPLHDSPASREELDGFSRILKEQRRLLQERQAILSQIRAIPGFEHFLKAVPYHTLRNAASGGPVIIINHCVWRCDIVIVLCDAPPSLIPTTRQFYEQAIALETRLLDARKEHLLESKQYDRVLRSVLEELYQLVGLPVIDKLRELRIPPQSRVWWCPTSVFCSLPLHAMGPIPSNDNQKSYFSDLYVCSYTPTLGALIASRSAGAQVSGDSPSLLMVGQPDAYLQGVKGEIRVVRNIGIPVTSLVSEEATRAAVVQGLKEHRLVHFACHGTLEPGRPFDAAFKLHGGDRLTLLDIMRSRLSVAEFAFLSACHTAELADAENPDEALHLTAAMQYSGFRSVVGTMWAMADIDGMDLSARFYRSMLSPDRDGDGTLCEWSARALQSAVQGLRNKEGVTLERWVNFVHYGL